MHQLAGQQCSDEWYQAIFRANSQPMLFFDQKTLAFLDVNQAAIDCYGYSRKEFLRMTIKELRLPEDEQSLTGHLPQVLSGPFRHGAIRHHKKDGSVLYIELTTHPLHYADRPAVFVTANNVTEQKRVEEKLESALEQYESLFLKHPDLIFTLDLDGHFLRVNPAAVAMGGYLPQEVVGQSYLNFVYPEDRTKAKQGFQNAAAGQTNRFEIRGIHHDGRHLWLDVINMPIVIDHTIIGVYGIIRDITQQRVAETALQKKSEELLRAQEAASMMMWEWDTITDKMIAFGDPYPIYGLRDVSNWSVADYSKQCPKAEITRALKHKTPYELECCVIWPDGTTHWMVVRGHPFENPEGHLCVAGIFMDITRRKRAEKALSRANAELEQKVGERTAELGEANRELKKLSAYLQAAREEERTHIAREIHDELGGALTAIKYDLAVVGRRGNRNSDAVQHGNAESLKLIDSAIHSLRRIISDLRPSILDDLGIWAALEWLAKECENRTGIPCGYVMQGQETEISRDLSVAVFRIVQELLTNVARHSKATQANIKVGVHNHELTVRIRDNGIGIAKENVLSSKSFGILGIHERVQYFKGYIRFHGQPEKGTIVNLKFPLTGP